MKEEALKLADLLAISGTDSIEREASAMIRRLVEELDKQNPLSDEEINQIAKDELIGWACDEDMLSFARAIEERHGLNEA